MELERLTIDRSQRRARPPRGGRPRWLVPAVAVILALAGLLLLGGPILRAVDRWRLPEVRVATATLANPAASAALRGTAANGHVVAARRAALSTDLPGRIVEMNVTEGSVVRAGDVVARLAADDYVAARDRAGAQLRVAEAALTRARAGVEAARAGVANAERRREAAESRLDEARAAERLAAGDLERARSLVQDGVSPERDLEAATATAEETAARRRAAEADLRAARSTESDARARARVAEADRGVAEAQLEAAGASLAEAEAVLEKTIVRAPFDGIVVLKDAEVGEVVSPSSQAGSNARGSVATLVDIDSLEVQADVPETSLAAVELGAPVGIFLDAYPSREYRGHVERIWPTANRQKATLEVRASFERPDERLRPEMGVRLVFLRSDEIERAPGSTAPGSTPEPSLLVPEEAVVRVEGEPAAFVLERDRVRLRSLELGPARSGRVSVLSGLGPGQRVVLDPPPRLEDGDRVVVEGE